MFVLLPLPWLAGRWLPPADPLPGTALRVPFFSALKNAAARGWRSRLRTLLSPAFAAWIFLVLAASQPQWAGNPHAIPATGRDLMLVIDISGSMRAPDFTVDGEAVDRLTMVKRVAGRFIERRQGDRLGLILFGARPYLRAPLSYDHKTIGALLEEAEVALAGEYTAVGDAIGLAVKRMRRLKSESRVVVLLTDGANNTGSIGPRWAARLAAAEGIRVYTIGIGKDDVAAPNPYGTWSSSGANDFNREVLEAVAAHTGGVYFHALDHEAMESAYRRLDQLEPAFGGGIKNLLAIPLYPWPLGVALLVTLWMAARRKGRGADHG